MARLCGFSIFRLIAYLKAELLLVLGTSSSEAALPSLMEKLEKAGCAKPVVGMVVPTGYSFNLDGTNIYMTLAALFVAQATGVDLSLGDQVALLLVAMVSSKGAAGVTGAGFITLAATLTAVPTVPVAGLALILGIDRFMSECRALTNFIGNALAAIVVAKWEKALDRDALEPRAERRTQHPSQRPRSKPTQIEAGTAGRLNNDNKGVRYMISNKARWARHGSRTALVLARHRHAGCAARRTGKPAEELPRRRRAKTRSSSPAAASARETYDTPAPVIGGVGRGSGRGRATASLARRSPTCRSCRRPPMIRPSPAIPRIRVSARSNCATSAPTRTLVLIDGRRTVSNSGIINLVSLSTIPTDFVDRVEIVTGGTSSVYGSDAVAGVVNIITKKNERALTLRARTGITSRGDGQELTLGATWARALPTGAAIFLSSGTYDRDWGIRATDREWATRPVAYEYDFDTGLNMFEGVYLNASGVPTSGSQPASSFPPLAMSDLSSFIPGGVFSGGNSSRDRFYRNGELVPLGPDVQTGEPIDVGTTDNGNTGYFLPNRDGYNQRTGRSLILARKRYLGAAKLDFEFSDNLEGFAQVQYSRIDSGETREILWHWLGFDLPYHRSG